MRQDARTQTAIELLAAIQGTQRPADGTASSYFRDRRFIGSKDRREISDRVWGMLRRQAHLDWWVSWVWERIASKGKGKHEAGSPFDDAPMLLARAQVLADLVLTDGNSPEQVAELFSGQRFAPEKLKAEEKSLVNMLVGRTHEHPDMPDWVKGECPNWMFRRLKKAMGGDIMPELAALNEPARVNLRANALKGTRDDAIALMKTEGISATPTKHSPLGLSMQSRINLPALKAFKSGLIEVQDESSQLAALLAGAKPGQSVVDFCSGAGGKTLALAGSMKNKGRIIACDVSEGRLKRSKVRLKRAGAFNVTTRHIRDENDKWVKRKAKSFDLVFIDAPCSGTGTWRRNPDGKWRLTSESLKNLTETQGRILRSAARLVKPGGRLVYATCSLLREENEDQVEAMLAQKKEFTLSPIGPIWDKAIGTECPVGDKPMLRLTPAQHGTDGFFVAVMDRKMEEKVQKPKKKAEAKPGEKPEEETKTP